ncbi:hypothetical protein C2845_PM12G19420 [Panicum miliaceum]|uniref:UDP-N-acetylglucosamine transferase subunit ALG14 n=1 Tax=Panicum miliaceum TaxID=4540 RepID=A0A3L6QJ27_PANMI|nr:hypothetical protein C2845_PM12G19420 [Panicum miliaceum]
MGLDALAAACCVLPVLLALLAVRFAYVLWRSGQPSSRSPTAGLRCLIVLGSGGHTAEMMNIVTALQKDRFTPRYYVAALTDNMSLQKAQVYEQSLIQVESGEKIIKNAHFMQIYRSREIFCNGPGTCFPLCVCAFVLKVLGLGWSSIFYIESIARVKKLSLSGLLLYKLRIADQFYVQWPQLQQKYPRAYYAGRLM